MTHLLAYHPERLATLRNAVVNAIIELRGTTCGLYEALPSDAAVRRMRKDLEVLLLPTIDRILSSAPLHRNSPGVDLDRLDQSLFRVMSSGYGWHLATDFVGDDATVVTPEEARALGAMLNDADVDDLLNDPEQMAWLAQQLEIISRDPALTAAFLANFHDWARLCNALGYARVDLTVRGDDAGAEAIAAVARIDRVVTALAATRAVQLTDLDQCTDPAALIPQFDEMTPYAAALVARELSLDPQELAAVSALILTRWQADNTYEYDSWTPGPNAADLLFEAIAASPEAAAAFVLYAADHPAILFQSADDPALAYQVALIGTAPDNLPTELAGEVVITFLHWFETSERYLNPVDPTYPTGWELFLADLITPWTLQFSPLNSDWDDIVDQNDTTKAALLAFVVQNDGALQQLIANGPQLIDGLVVSVDHRDQQVIAELVAYLNMLSQLIVNQRVADAEAEAAAWDLLLDVVDLVAAVATLPAGPAVSIGTDLALLGASGLVGSLTDAPMDVAAAEQLAHEHRQAAIGSMLAAACFRSLVSQGRLPAGTPPPPLADPDEDDPLLTFCIEFGVWLDQLRAAGYDDEAELMDDVVGEAVNAAMAGADAAT